MLTILKYSISFKSNRERERELAELRALAKLREQQRQAALLQAQQEAMELAKREAEKKAKQEKELRENRIRILDEVKHEISKYPDPDNELSTKMARFLSQFTCAIQNDSEHDISEFFGDEDTAKEAREKLSPECQHDSLELREEIQKIDEVNDPVMMLIAANKMKKFVPKAGILSEEQQANLLQGLKDTIIMAVKNTDLTKFDEEEIRSINEMLQMIEVADTVDFGISFKLNALIDKLNKKKLKVGFIPPVKVRELVKAPVLKESMKL